MQKHYLGILEKGFSDHLVASLGFRKVPEIGDLLPSDWCLYEFEDSDISFFVVLAPNPKNDTYTVELAWSITKQFPKNLLPGFLGDPAVAGAFRFRIGEFWNDHDYWEFFAKREIYPEYNGLQDKEEAKLKSSAKYIVGRLSDFLPSYMHEVRHKIQNSES